MTMNLSGVRVVDPILTTVVQGYRLPGLIGENLFPRVPVGVAGGKVLQFGKEAFLSYNTQRAPGAATKRITFGYLGQPYALENHGAEAPVPREWLRDAKVTPGVDLGTRATNLVMRVILKSLEAQQAGLATNAANYDANHKLALSGSTKWSASTGTPKADIEAGKEAIRTTCGLRPNVLALSAVAFKALKENPNVISRFQYVSKDSITPEMIANLFDVAKVVVGDDITADDSGNFTDVWGNNAILAYVPPVPSTLEEPSYGYTYTMEGHPLVEVPYYDNNAKSWVYGVGFERIPVLTGLLSGFLIQNPN
jgi:hypothetical protein